MTATLEKLTRQEMIDALRLRDGDICQFPDCNEVLDFSVVDGPKTVTIDHWIPQHYGKTESWSWEEIWHLSNLKLMTKKCNAKKGDRIPDENGVLPEKAVRKFRYRRDKRANRPDYCADCDNGHALLIGETCAACNCDAQRFPRSAKVRFDECDHDILWCWVCSITPDMRPSAMESAIRQAESGEWDEYEIDS